MALRIKPILTFTTLPRPKLQHEQVRTSLFNKYRHGPQEITNPKMSVFKYLWDQICNPEGRQELKDEFKHMMWWPFKPQFNFKPEPNKLYAFERFDSENALKKWKPVCDRDGLNGYSTSFLTRSPSGHALFHGTIDNTLPDDGLTANSGFAGIIGPRAPNDHIFHIEPFWDWKKFNCLEIRFRGDGRKYAVVLSRGSHFDDLGYYDNYAYPIYTRGGPHWQTLSIPFSKFIYNYKSFIQDRQGYLPAHKIGFVAIVIHDKVDGPFALEIDYIGLKSNDLCVPEFTPYEAYKIKHIRFRPLQVESPPPQV